MSAPRGHVPPPARPQANGAVEPTGPGSSSRASLPNPSSSLPSSTPSSNGFPPSSRPPRRLHIADSNPPLSTSSSAASSHAGTPASAVSPSELKRRRPSHSPSSFALTEDPPLPLTSLPLDSYDSLDGGAHLTLLNGTITAHTRRKLLDPDDKYGEKHTPWRRLWQFLSPPPPLHHPRNRPLPPPRALGRMWDPHKPLTSLMRFVCIASLCVALFLLLSLFVWGGRTALLRVTHPLTHLGSSFPLLSSPSNESIDPLLLSPALNSFDFTIVASFFSNPQSPSTSTRILQWHSLLSFVGLVPPHRVLVYTNSPTDCNQFIQQTFEGLQCFQFSDAIHPDLNLPYVSPLLAHAHAHAPTDLIVYAHHDILLAPSLTSSIHALVDALPHHSFVATSRRLDFRLPPDMVDVRDFSVPLTEAIVGGARAAGRIYPNDWNVDFLVYSKGWYDKVIKEMPPFVYSDYYWANHLIATFLLQGGGEVAVVDLTEQQLVIHQKTNDTQDGIFVTDMKALAQHNYKIARNHSDLYLYGFLTNIPYTLTGHCPACSLQPNPDASTLLLAKRQVLDGWLIVMNVDEATSPPQVYNWLCWAERANVTNYLLVSSSVETGYRRLYEVGFPVLFVGGGSGGASQVVSYLLQYGYDILSMDWDHLLIQSPFPYMAASPFDVMLKGDDNNLYTGLFALRSSHYSHYYWDLVLSCQAQQSHVADVSQHIDCYASTYRDVKILVKGGVLDLLHFPTVKSYFVDQISQRTGTMPYIIETSPKAVQAAHLHIAGDDATCEDPQRPSFPALTSNPPLVVRVLTSSHVEHLKALLASLSSAQYDGDRVELEIAIDFPHGNATEEEMKGHQGVVGMASTYIWAHGEVLVTVQDKVRVGTARLIHADVNLERLAYVVVLTDEVVLSSQWYLSTRHLLSLYNTDPQLMGLSLTAENEILGETHNLRSSRRRALDETQSEPPVFFWQRPSSALVFLPYQWVELVLWMQAMQAEFPAYHPCIPTLITNHRNGWQEWVSKWMYERGMYMLYTNFPSHSVLAMKPQEEVDPHYQLTLIHVKTFQDMRVLDLKRVSGAEWHVFDFHLRRLVSPLPLLSRAQVQFASKQCWVMDDWKGDEAAKPNMAEDELMTEEEEERRHAKQRRRHASPPSSNASSPNSPARAEDGLAGHVVSEQMIAGVRPLRKARGEKGGKNKGGADAWAEAAAAAIAESHEKGAQEVIKEAEAKKKEHAEAAAALPHTAPPHKEVKEDKGGKKEGKEEVKAEAAKEKAAADTKTAVSIAEPPFPPLPHRFPALSKSCLR